MYHLHTPKQLKYFDEVIRLHYEEEFEKERMSRLFLLKKKMISLFCQYRNLAIFS